MSPVLLLLPPVLLAAGLLLIVLAYRSEPAAPTTRPTRISRFHAGMHEWMAQAGLRDVSPLLVATLCGALALVVGVVALGVTQAAAVAAAFAVLAASIPVLLLRARRRHRLRELQGIWPDAIDHLASGVRAGLSLPEAVTSLAERGPEPLRAPIGVATAEYRATGRFAAALDRLKTELADPTADRVVECLRITREVGGPELGRTLRTLAAFLRDEHRVRRELEARQTWVVVAARLAFATPLGVLLLLASQPQGAAAYSTSGGAVVIIAGLAMAVAGYRLMLLLGRMPSERRVLR